MAEAARSPRAVCPDPDIYSRLNKVERTDAVHTENWRKQEAADRETAAEIDRLCDAVTRLTTTLKTTTAILSFLVVVAGVVAGFLALR